MFKFADDDEIDMLGLHVFTYLNKTNVFTWQKYFLALLTLLLLRHFSWKLLSRSKPVNCLFWLLTQMCTQGHFCLVLLSFWPSWTIPDNAFYQSKTVDSFWPVNVLTTRKVWQCLTFKCTRYTLASISKFWLILTRVVVGGWTITVNSMPLWYKLYYMFRCI